MVSKFHGGKPVCVRRPHLITRSIKKRFQWIRENILFPFINWGRKDYDDFDVDSGAPMGDELTAVSWCDGDHSQIDTIVSPDGIHRYSANKDIANKHNASGTGKEQACDWVRYLPSPRILTSQQQLNIFHHQTTF